MLRDVTKLYTSSIDFRCRLAFGSTIFPAYCSGVRRLQIMPPVHIPDTLEHALEAVIEEEMIGDQNSSQPPAKRLRGPGMSCP